MRIVVYARVSTDKQVEEGFSLEAQIAKLRKYADAHDYEIVSVKVDAGISAKSMDRPALQEALAMLSTGQANGIAVVKLDRLTRSLSDLLRMIEEHFAKGRVLISLAEKVDTSSPIGRFTLTIMGAVAQLEREQTSERTIAAIDYMRAAGFRTVGEVPIGFVAVPMEGDRRQRLALRPGWDRAVEIVRATSGLSLGETGKFLAANGFLPNERATGWQRTQVARFRKSVAERLAVTG